MSTNEYLIPVERFSFYAENYALAAESGIESANVLLESRSTIANTDTSTFEVFQNAVAAKNNLSINLRSSFEQIYTNAFVTSQMSASFKSLFEHIKKYSGLTIDEYLTENSLTVRRSFANLAQIFGESISESNIQ